MLLRKFADRTRVDIPPRAWYNHAMEVNVNGVTLYYEKTGSGAPLIMLHGNGESHDIFDRAVPLLSERFTVYTPDTRGHGNSSPVSVYHYRDMAQDLIAFVHALGLEKPVLYGFSDGGITALLAASLCPDLAARVIASGVNISPNGLSASFLYSARREWCKTRDPLLALMLNEPDITGEELANICIPVCLTVATRDLVRLRHTRKIAAAIRGSSLCLLKHETHGSYIVHSDKIARLILSVCGRG